MTKDCNKLFASCAHGRVEARQPGPTFGAMFNAVDEANRC
jgi:hypothetical protein